MVLTHGLLQLVNVLLLEVELLLHQQLNHLVSHNVGVVVLAELAVLVEKNKQLELLVKLGGLLAVLLSLLFNDLESVSLSVYLS